MWAEVNGERKKVACGPCIRGHRSSKCDHRDRVLVEVRKPGRPLSSCPHPTGSCSCERVVINYTIPKVSQCACPSEREAPTATVVGNSRISKGRRKSTAVTPFYLDKAIRAGLDTETDTSSSTQAPSETSGSNAPSLPSSASSTPRLLPTQNEPISSCCKPKQEPKQAPAPVQGGGCCSSKVNPAPEPLVVQKKSCCSGTPQKAATNYQPSGYQPAGPQFQYFAQNQGIMPQYQLTHPQTLPPNAPNPFGLGTPIYNHAAAAYHQNSSVPMSPGANTFMAPNMTTSSVNQHTPEHNCHCGESCSCFGCAAHPTNATMMEYVRVMAHFQYTGDFGGMVPPLYDMPTYPHQPGYGAEAGQRMGYDSMSQGMATPTQTRMNSQSSLDSPTKPNQSMSIPGDWQQPLGAMQNLSQTSFLGNMDYANSNAINENSVPLKREDTTDTSVAGSPRDEETPTLSPSSFFWNEMTLPGCSDASGTCQCGDGCACVGCLTHGGHTGEHLEDISTTEQNNFPEFTPNLSFNMNSPSNFMGFTAGPS